MLRNDFVGEVKEGFWILLFLLQESKRDKRLHYSEKFPDFVVSSAGVQEGDIKNYIIRKSSRILLFLLQESKMDRRLHYSEKFLDFVVSSAICKSQRWIKD